jgi:hypothetical protein
MFDYEGSRSEFLKILAETGEEPAFINRGRAPQFALDALLKSCSVHREERLEWPRRHFATLYLRTAGEWSRLQRYLAAKDDVNLFAVLECQLAPIGNAAPSILASDRALLRQFIESAARFNQDWLSFVDGSGLEHVNELREDYNRYYPMEKACAFGRDTVNEGFNSLPLLDSAFLLERFPLLLLPELA